MKRLEVQLLRQAGRTYAQIAEQTGVPERTARRIVAEGPVEQVLSPADGSKVGRPSVSTKWRAAVEGWLQGPGANLPTRELLRRAKGQGYRGGKSAFYSMVAEVRPPKVDFTVRFDGMPGEFSQHDFGEVDVTYTDGSKAHITFFASRLKYSRYIRVSVVPNQTAETIARTVCQHLTDWGGLPLMAVFDRPKTVAIKWRKDGTITQYNETLQHAMMEMGVGMEVCWPYSPNQKGAIEQVVKYVKNSFFKVRAFNDLSDLMAQLELWHDEVNDELKCRATGETPRARLELERARLRPIKLLPQNLALRVSVHVGPTAEVAFESNHYSMPPGACGLTGTAFVFQDTVKIVAGKFTALHPRLASGARQISALDEHRAEQLAAVSGKRGKRYLQRQQLLDLGGPMVQLISEICRQAPDRWFSEVEHLYGLLQKHGEARLRIAVRIAISSHSPSVAAVAAALLPPLITTQQDQAHR